MRMKPIDMSQVRTGSVRRRHYRLSVDDQAGMPDPTRPLGEFFTTLPATGQAALLLDAARLLAAAALESKPVFWIIDGAFIRAGLAPQLVYLMRRGLVQCVAIDGAAAVHDYELAFHGAACEAVGEGLADGQLGLARETGEGLTAIINEGVRRGFSLGECLGRGILDRQPRYFSGSILATGAARLIPVTVHTSIGAEGFHRYPGADGAMLGKGSLKDAHLLASLIATLPAGAIVVSAHRSVALGDVFTHAYGLARNLTDSLGGVHRIEIGSASPLAAVPQPGRSVRIEGALEIFIPLIMGALFSLVE